MNVYDIALLKLMSASNRANHKDIYDLDYLTDHIQLTELMGLLNSRQKKYDQPEYQNIFDQDSESSPVDNPDLLFKFEEPIKGNLSGPGHSIRVLTLSKEEKIGRLQEAVGDVK